MWIEKCSQALIKSQTPFNCFFFCFIHPGSFWHQTDYSFIPDLWPPLRRLLLVMSAVGGTEAFSVVTWSHSGCQLHAWNTRATLGEIYFHVRIHLCYQSAWSGVTLRLCSKTLQKSTLRCCSRAKTENTDTSHSALCLQHWKHSQVLHWGYDTKKQDGTRKSPSYET